MNAKARKDKAKKVTKKSTASKAAKAKKSVAKKVAVKKATTKKSVAKKTVSKAKTSQAVTKAKTAKPKNVKATKSAAKASAKNTIAKAKSKKIKAVSSGNILDATNLAEGSFVPYAPEVDESYMSDSQLQHFRSILLDWKQELMSEVDETIKELKEAGIRRVPADPNDRASQEENFSVELRTRDRERKLIKKIDDALKMIDNKEYGYCESCGEEIGLRRLEARPTAFLCIDCKTLDEIREKRNA